MGNVWTGSDSLQTFFVSVSVHLFCLLMCLFVCVCVCVCVHRGSRVLTSSSVVQTCVCVSVHACLRVTDAQGQKG